MRPLAALALGMMAASVLAACSPGALLGLVQPRAAGGEVRDVVYGVGPRGKMDLYVPAAAERAAPVVVFFYGGGWKAGDRAMYRFVGRDLAACGFLTIIPDYRVWPEAGFDGFMKDAAAAVAAARREAPRYGGDPSRLFLMGHSAGAHIAAMLALDPAWLAGAGVDTRTALSGMVGLAGPYDFLPLNDPVLEQIFAPVGPRTQPITFAASATAPFLLLTGADDQTVRPANSTRLAARINAHGGQARAVVYPSLSHVAIVGSLAAPLRFLAPVGEDVCRFLGARSQEALSPAPAAQNTPAPAAQNTPAR